MILYWKGSMIMSKHGISLFSERHHRIKGKDVRRWQYRFTYCGIRGKQYMSFYQQWLRKRKSCTPVCEKYKGLTACKVMHRECTQKWN